MNTIFLDLVAEGKVMVYLDDILIYSSTCKEHCRITHKVLQRLLTHDLYLRPEKCEFEQKEVEYLGLIIKKGEVTMVLLMFYSTLIALRTCCVSAMLQRLFPYLVLLSQVYFSCRWTEIMP